MSLTEQLGHFFLLLFTNPTRMWTKKQTATEHMRECGKMQANIRCTRTFLPNKIRSQDYGSDVD